MIGFDFNVLLGHYQARTNLAAGGGAPGAAALAKRYAPTAPWASRSPFPKADALAKSVLLGRRFIDETAAKLDLDGASSDYKKLFALYQGVNALAGLAGRAGAKGVTQTELARLARTFDKGLAEVAGYADGLKLEQLRLTRGDTFISARSQTGVPKSKPEYVTRTLHTGKLTDEIPDFQGAAAFNIAVRKAGVTTNIAVNLADLGAQPRTIGAVVNLINDKLAAAGMTTRFAVERTTGQPREVKSGSKTITLPPLGDALAFRIKGDTTEALTFSAAATQRPAVFVTTRSGDPDPDKDPKTQDGKFQNSLLKLDPAAGTGVGSKIRTADLEGTILGVRQSVFGEDGSLYVLADVEKTVSGQGIKGEQDVAVLKYDSAGNLAYARTLGAAATASGLAMAVATDGRVAIAGSIKGELTGASAGPLNSSAQSGKTDSFVTLFDSSGDEVWTQRRGALQDDEATALAFGDDGSLYVAGRTRSALPGVAALGGWDSYLTAIATNDKGAPVTLFTQQFGTAADDALAGVVFENGRIVVAGVEDGSAVLRSFEVSLTETRITRTWASGMLTVTTETYTGGALTGSQSAQFETPGAPDGSTVTSYTSGGAATALATRSLGEIQGGSVAGLKIEDGQLYVAGHTRNAAFGVDGLSRAHAGGMDAFAARLSTDLTSTAQDALAYFGGAGDNTVAGFDVLGGQVFIAGAAGADLPGLTAIGQKDGYYAGLDLANGAITAAQRLSGKDGVATATSIAVAATGASDLDRFGLPAGALEFKRSQLIVAATSARPGDTFQIRTRAGARPSTITLEANDTLETLAVKVRRVAGFNAKVEVASNGDNRVLKISPRNDAATFEILPGKGGRDLLDALGLPEGVARNTKVVDGKSISTAAGGNVYGIGLRLDLKLSSEDEIKRASTILDAALSRIRIAYRDLEAAAKPKTPASNTPTGPVPAYLQAQIANYQAGLDRLNGGF